MRDLGGQVEVQAAIQFSLTRSGFSWVSIAAGAVAVRRYWASAPALVFPPSRHGKAAA